MTRRTRMLGASCVTFGFLVLGVGAARPAYATTFNGEVWAYPSVSGAADPGWDYVNVSHMWYYSMWSPDTNCKVCATLGYSAATRVRAAGTYSYTVTANPITNASPTNVAGTSCYVTDCAVTTSGKMIVRAIPESSESTAVSWTDSDFTPDTTVQLPDIRNAPHEVRERWWVRRIGNGQYPVFFIEDFDPLDSYTTDFQKIFMQLARLNTGTSMLDYLTGNDFTVWLVTSGSHGGDSMAGRTSTGAIPLSTDNAGRRTGSVYDAMSLIAYTAAKYHPGHNYVVGGYGTGGLVAKIGMLAWCGGNWAGLNSQLTAGCPTVNMYFAADAPLKGATIAIALQRPFRDYRIRGKLGTEDSALADAMLSSWVAREMVQWQIVSPDNSCNTNCDDVGGCESTDSSFVQGTNCFYISPGVHGTFWEFMNWAGTERAVARSTGGTVPGVGLSVGQAPTATGQGCNTLAGTRDTPFKMIKIAISLIGDIHLWSNTAGGAAAHECEHGSRFNLLAALNRTDMGGGGLVHIQSITTYYFPTFVPSRSSLLWDDGISTYTNYWYEDADNNHSLLPDSTYTIPVNGTGFLTAWIWEYLRGAASVPRCSSVRSPYGKVPVTCRT